jgi:uncharacterized protein
VAEALIAGGDRYPALMDLLAKSSPRIAGKPAGEPIVSGANLQAEAIDAVRRLDGSYLFIQGPPGSGKTYTSAAIIIALLREGRKVGVASNSHKAIHALLDEVEARAARADFQFEGIKKGSGDEESQYSGRCIRTETKTENIDLSAQLIAGTAWLFAHPRLDRVLDYVFIDEAGQVALANVVAIGTAARNIVLVGDQMQLGQPTQGVHPGDAGLSVLEFLLGEQATIGPDRGIFLPNTRRLHPSVCRFISDAFYDGRLHPDPENENRNLVFRTPVDGLRSHGIQFVAADHEGCSQKSDIEGTIVRELYGRFVGQEFRDKDGSIRPVTGQDVLVVTPYNMQVNYLRSVLPQGARIGTVDKFQGQEAPIVIVSMVTSSAEDLPRHMEFLYSRNRLNVAISRAQCLAVVVANPRLLEYPCRTINQMKLVNTFCWLHHYAAQDGG